MRPAVNVSLSVTRVGRQTMGKLPREVHKILIAFLSRYDKLQNLSHFGQELTDDVKKALNMGDLIYKFFKQPYEETVPINVQMIILSMIFNKIIDNKRSLRPDKKRLNGSLQRTRQTKDTCQYHGQQIVWMYLTKIS